MEYLRGEHQAISEMDTLGYRAHLIGFNTSGIHAAGKYEFALDNIAALWESECFMGENVEDHGARYPKTYNAGQAWRRRQSGKDLSQKH